VVIRAIARIEIFTEPDFIEKQIRLKTCIAIKRL